MSEKSHNSELPSVNVVEVPPIETLTNRELAEKTWPDEIVNNPEFVAQVCERENLIRCIEEVVSCLPKPTTTLSEALQADLITPKKICELYDALSNTLSNPDYQRLALYLPFEFLPEAGWDSDDQALSCAITSFKDTYLSAWENTLIYQDVRANFVDGDVLEVDKRTDDLPRVVKAAHLIPKLLEKGLFSVDNVMELIDTADDIILQNSIGDTLPVIYDLGLATADELDRMCSKLNIDIEQITTPRKPESNRPNPASQDEIRQIIEDGIAEIETADYGDAAEKRVQWLKLVKKEGIIATASDQLAELIKTHAIDLDVVDDSLNAETAQVYEISIIEGLRKILEEIGHEDLETSRGLFNKHQEYILKLWDKNEQTTQDALTKMLRRLYQLGVVSGGFISEIGITIPHLEGPLSKNIKHFDSEVASIAKASQILPKETYPIILLYGSRLKGYGGSASDIDTAVFVKPGTDTNDAGNIGEEISRAIPSDHGETIQFWLDNQNDHLEITDFPFDGEPKGEKAWTYMLFGTVWTGDKKAISELQSELLVPYFFEDEEIAGRSAHSIYIEGMEKDALLYRLLHKGHESYYPDYGGINTPHSDKIDGGSKFWDSGYRQMATQIYANRVFLPKLTK